jgi:hypothetical protein
MGLRLRGGSRRYAQLQRGRISVKSQPDGSAGDHLRLSVEEVFSEEGCFVARTLRAAFRVS